MGKDKTHTHGSIESALFHCKIKYCLRVSYKYLGYLYRFIVNCMQMRHSTGEEGGDSFSSLFNLYIGRGRGIDGNQREVRGP